MAVLFEPAHDAGGGVEAEGAATRQEDAVDTVDEVAGAQNVGLTRGRGAAADVDGGDGAGGAEDDCTAGCGGQVGRMADE